MEQLRKATLKDIKAIHGILNFYAQQGSLLARPLISLYERVRELVIYERDDEVIGCAALSVVWEDMAEIRSLAVKEEFQRRNIGTKLVNACLDEARFLQIKRVFTLTYKDKFFEKMGFHVIDKHILPHKIWSDCVNCPSFPDCDEIAMLMEIQ